MGKETRKATAQLQKLTWKEIRHEVHAVNPELAKIIDEIDPDDRYWLAKVSYPYGSMVMERAVLNLPNKNGQLVPITDSSLDPEIREGLGYNLKSNPVSLALKNTFEIYLPLEDRTIPLSGIITPGTAFGAWRILNPFNTEHPAFIWDMTSGARSVFMLPKITEAKKHMSLKKIYDLTVDTPRSLMGHWEIFRQLAKHPNFREPWEGEILYFSQEWFKNLNDSNWKPFYYYFYDSAWGASELWRNQFMWDLIFSLILKDYEARPSAYIMDTAKYLLYMGVAAFPGLAPAKNDLAGPFKEIQRIYSEEYNLKNYPPIIMQPTLFNPYNQNEPSVYYSLQFPNAVEFKPNSRIRTSTILDLHEIRSLLIRCEQELQSDKFNIKGTSLSNLFNYTKYDYFHNGVDLHAGMRNSAEMPKEDPQLLTTVDGKKYNNFPDTCSFVKGCIRLSHKKSNST
jgi:hypothetical protein